MANIYVPNIIITQDYDLINKIMESDRLDITQQYSEDRAILLSNRQNKYVYALEHSISFNQTDTKIVLKILDVDDDFENKFFNETFFERIMNQQVSNFIKNNAKINEFGTYVNNALTSQIQIYIAYGIGDDFSNWSNPISCVLANAKIDLANNGLRTYTYEFQPEVNYFFKYHTIEFDKNDLLNNLNLSFGGGTVRTRSDITINPDQYKQITLNVKGLLSKFVSKVTNVSRSNCITLIPDIDSANNKTIKINRTEQFKEWQRLNPDKARFRNPYLKGPDDEMKKIDWNDQVAVISFYRQYFKNIFGWKTNPVNCVTPIVNKKFKTTRLKEDVLSEINSKLEKERKKADKSAREDQQEINELDAKITELERNRDQLKEELSSPNLSGGMKGERRKEKLKQINSKLDGLISDRAEARENKNAVDNLYNKSISKLQKEAIQAKGVVDLTKEISDILSPNSTFSETKLVPDRIKTGIQLSLVAMPDPNKSQDSNDPKLPDWYKAIQNVFLGIASLHNNGDSFIVPHISYESDAKFLKLFHKHKMIEDPTKPCVIVGDRQMVLDYIYRNQIPVNQILNHKSKFQINKSDKLYKILNDQQYAIDLRNLVRKKKNSSSFNEKIMLDELTYDRSVANLIEQYSEADDIPVFLNNFKNSNVLSYSVDNTENYANVTRSAVAENRFKTLLSQMSEEKLSKVLETGGIASENGLTPVNIAKSLFKESVGKIVDGIDKTSKLSSNVINAYTTKKQFYATALRYDLYFIRASKPPEELQKKYDLDLINFQTAESKLSEEDLKIYKLLNNLADSDKSDPYIFTNSQENVTVMSAILQATLVKKYKLIPPENVLPLAEVIILLNKSSLQTENSQVEILPGLYLPNQSFILGKITHYAIENFLKVVIKTLPFFYLSNYRTIGQTSLFYSKKLNVMNYNNLDTLDYFSGEFRITGFKHVITTRECYSEFILNKDNALAGDQIKSPTKS